MYAALPIDSSNINPPQRLPVPATPNPITHLFWTVVNVLTTVLQMVTLPLYALYDEGLANFLGLQVLRHGTSLCNYVSICTNGADPNRGYSHEGSARAVGSNSNDSWAKNCPNHFHVFKDSNASTAKTGGCLASLSAQFFIRVLPTYHGTLAGTHSFTAEKEENRGCCSPIAKIAGGALSFFTPTLRFKFAEEDMKNGRFENDEDYGPLALRTKLPITPKRIGITGSLFYGLNLGFFARIYHHPCKFLLGLIQLVAAVALTLLLASALLPILL